MKDLEQMAAFYSAALGLKPVDGANAESWIEFEGGETWLALHAIPAHIASTIEIAEPPRAREENPVKLVFEVDDLAAAKASLQAHGAIIVERSWGACDALDPEGNVFQIVEA